MLMSSWHFGLGVIIEAIILMYACVVFGNHGNRVCVCLAREASKHMLEANITH